MFRVGAGRPHRQPFGGDEGKTWTAATNTPADVLSVQPCLLVRGDGAVVLSGGRPGLFLWVDTAGDGRNWQRVEMHPHHDACRPDEPLDRITIDGRSRTTGYTRIVPLPDDRLLYVYDRVPHGWSALPQDSTETNSVWAVQVSLRRKPRDEAGEVSRLLLPSSSPRAGRAGRTGPGTSAEGSAGKPAPRSDRMAGPIPLSHLDATFPTATRPPPR